MDAKREKYEELVDSYVMEGDGESLGKVVTSACELGDVATVKKIVGRF